MRFLDFGEKRKPTIVLIHAFGITWRMWTKHIDELSKDYHLVVPVLDGMDDEYPSDFHSIEASSEEIIGYVKKYLDGRVFAIIGVSLGGTIAADILSKNEIEVKKAVIDGGPVIPFNKAVLKFATVSRRWQMKKMAERKGYIVNPMRKFVTEELVKEFVKVAGFVTKATFDNVHVSAFGYRLPDTISNTSADIAFWYGSKEFFHVKKSIALFKEKVPGLKVKEFKGCNHGEACMRLDPLYIKSTLDFLGDEEDNALTGLDCSMNVSGI